MRYTNNIYQRIQMNQCCFLHDQLIVQKVWSKKLLLFLENPFEQLPILYFLNFVVVFHTS